MKKFRRVIAGLLVALLAVVGFAGCGGGGSDSGDTPAEEAKTINILMETVPDTDFVIANLDKFKEETGITVNVESINYSAMHEKLLTQMLSAENSYDVIVVDCYWSGEFSKAGWLEDLGPYIEESKFDISPYLPSMMEMVGTVDGTTYMIPFYNYMLGLVYRTDVFEDQELKSGYEAATGKEFKIPDNLKDYVELCKYITSVKGEALSGAAMMGLRPDPISMEWLNYLFSNGGDFYDAQGNITINSPEAVEALDLYIDNMKNAAPAGAPGFGFDEAYNVFAQGNAASYVTYNWMVPKLNDSAESKVAGTVELAQMPGGVSLNAGWGWAIPANAPDKEASWKFLQWVESFDIAKARALAGGSPTRSDVMSDPEVIAKYPHTEMVQTIMENSRIIPVISDAPQLIEVLGRELSEAVAGNKTSKEALDTVAEEMKSME
ncbi:MAG TPA: sugar ABC transporter substrate-binding protein [Anaerovoracaceae bacterium]|nr:sugar ABC transporter substrate-binding protein [Anaerovoracaceae bacterium]